MPVPRRGAGRWPSTTWGSVLGIPGVIGPPHHPQVVAAIRRATVLLVAGRRRMSLRRACSLHVLPTLVLALPLPSPGPRTPAASHAGDPADQPPVTRHHESDLRCESCDGWRSGCSSVLHPGLSTRVSGDGRSGRRRAGLRWTGEHGERELADGPREELARPRRVPARGSVVCTSDGAHAQRRVEVMHGDGPRRHRRGSQEDSAG